MPEMNLTDEDVNKALAEMQQRAAAFTPVEGRVVENDDFVQELHGTPEGGGDPLDAEKRVVPRWGRRDHGAVFKRKTSAVRTVGDHKDFDVNYPPISGPQAGRKTVPLFSGCSRHQEPRSCPN